MTISTVFQSPQSCPDREIRRSPPSKHSVTPALISLNFKGVIEYLEDLVTGIDAPQLDEMQLTFFNQIDFDTPRLAQSINRTPKLTRREAHVGFYDYFAVVGLSPGTLKIAISCREPDWQLSSIEQVCNSSLHPLSAVEDPYIDHRYSQLVWKDNAIKKTLWLQFLLPFTSMKNLYLDKEFASGIAAALQEPEGGRITEVFPRLQNIFVKRLGPSGPFQENIGEFVAARQLSEHPIAISGTKISQCLFISLEFFLPPFLSSVYRTLYLALSNTSSHTHFHAYLLPVSSYTLSIVECLCLFALRNGNVR
jgi:hypothetical protein